MLTIYIYLRYRVFSSICKNKYNDGMMLKLHRLSLLNNFSQFWLTICHSPQLARPAASLRKQGCGASSGDITLVISENISGIQRWSIIDDGGPTTFSNESLAFGENARISKIPKSRPYLPANKWPISLNSLAICRKCNFLEGALISIKRIHPTRNTGWVFW